MITDNVVRRATACATAAGIEPAALIAVIETETNGTAFEQDGRTPLFLYERHVAYREASKAGPEILKAFVAAGLAHPHWEPSTQYKDQGSSAKRLALIANARAIHEEVANRSASWGLGQTMGNECRNVGHNSATQLVGACEDLDHQIAVLIAEIRSKRLIGAMNGHDWKTFAYHYNGAGFEKNRYDVKLAVAWRKWSRQVNVVHARPVAPAEQTLTEAEIKSVQQRLRLMKYYIVGKPDGIWGPNTTAAVAAFQHTQGLPVTGSLDRETAEELVAGPERIIPEARANATADDLRDDGCPTIAHADKVNMLGKAKMVAGGALAAPAAFAQTGVLDDAQSTVDKAEQAKSLVVTLHDALGVFITDSRLLVFGVVLVIAGFFVSKYAKKVIDARVADHQAGIHNGVGD
jgi:hypothetical protein